MAAWATSPIDLAVDRIDRLYLHRAEIDAGSLLRSAAQELAGQVHWLGVRAEGSRVSLHHGDGRDLGTVEVRDMADLPRALDAMTRVVVAAGSTPEGLEKTLLVGLTRGLDRYSRVLSGRRIDGFSVRLTGTESGVGVTLIEDAGKVLVDAVVPGGPADAAIAVGDRVVAIDGIAVTSAADARERLRGVTGSPVELAIGRGDAERIVPLRRARVVVPNVTHRVLPGKVGYVHIEHVSQRTLHNLDRALDALRDAGSLQRGLVVDLRDNTGGSMKEAARVADRFVSEGLLLRTAGRDGGPIENLQHEMVARDRSDDLQLPVVILVNGRTASGAEILAGALVEHGRAAVVGQRTWGKGTVQKPMSLGEDLQLNLTVAHYVLANERRITSAGILPDVWVGHVGERLELRSWPEAWSSWSEVVPAVATRGDAEVELARRALLAVSAGPRATRDSRAGILEALRDHARGMRAEGLANVERLAREAGIDWSSSPTPLGHAVEVSLVARPAGHHQLRIEAEVASRAEVVLSRTVVQLHGSEPAFDGVVVPIGRIEPHGRARGSTLVALPGPGPTRLERVQAYVRVGDGAGVPAGDHLLTVPEVADPPTDGPHVVVDAPGLASPLVPLALPIQVGGPDVALDHVVVWANGQKVAWHGPGNAALTLEPVIELQPGPNRVLVEAVDAEGRARDVRLQILGIPTPSPAVSDATSALE